MFEGDLAGRHGPMTNDQPLPAAQFKPEQGSDVDIYQATSQTPSIVNTASTYGFVPPKQEAALPTIKPQSNPTPSSEDEEAENHTMTRMLEDGTGRLCRSIALRSLSVRDWRLECVGDGGLRTEISVRWGCCESIVSTAIPYDCRNDSRPIAIHT